MVTSNLNPNVVKTALDEVFYSEFNFMERPEYPSATNARIFNQLDSTKASETIEELQGIGYFNRRNELENPDETQPISKNQYTFTNYEYARGVTVGKHFFDDDQHGVWSKIVKDFGLTARKSRDLHAFEVYRSGFSTTYGDGVALFGSHTVQGGTQSNTDTIKLTETNFDTAIQALLLQKGLAGTIAGNTPDCLLVPTERFKGASIILDSQLRPATADNDANYYSNRFGIMLYVSPWVSAAVSTGTNITAGDADYWYLLSRNHGITRFDRESIDTNLIDWRVQKDKTYYYSAAFRQSVGAMSWVGSWGSTGSAGTYDA